MLNMWIAVVLFVLLLLALRVFLLASSRPKKRPRKVSRVIVRRRGCSTERVYPSLEEALYHNDGVDIDIEVELE